ncbi:MAG: InlB B-repeat-containing protein, partial [Bacterioplanes sp.]|nr:InlB B-repeat-containing protein [Bacterioplanes sp.]
MPYESFKKETKRVLLVVLFALLTIESIHAQDYFFAPNLASNPCSTTPDSDVRVNAVHTGNWRSCVTNANGDLSADTTFPGQNRFEIRANSTSTSLSIDKLIFNNQSGVAQNISVSAVDSQNSPLPQNESFSVGLGVQSIELSNVYTGFKTLTIQITSGNLTTFFFRGFSTVPQYTLTFDSDGGSSVSSITQGLGSEITAPANPSKTGYSFVGWSPVIPAIMPANNQTHTAQWMVNAYTLSFDSAGGSAVADITQDFGTNITEPTAPTRIGYTFEGWNPPVPATMPLNGSAHTAQWTVNAYTMSFDSAGGSTVADITQDFGTNITEPTAPTRIGYTFEGWNPPVPATMPLNGSAHTAQWTVNAYTMSFDSAGGSTV